MPEMVLTGPRRPHFLETVFNAERAQTYLNYTWVDVDGDGNKGSSDWRSDKRYHSVLAE